MTMQVDLSEKKALLAGTVDALLVGVGTALRAAGAHLVAAQKSPLWSGTPHQVVELSPDDPESLKRTLPAIGVPDILIFNAGWRRYASFIDHSPADWDDATRANFEAPLYLAQAAARLMIAQGRGGRIIFLSGVEGQIPFAGTAAAGTTLTMLAALARMAAVNLAPHQITVNLIAAGWTHADRYGASDDETRQHVVGGIPIGRLGSPEHIGAAAVFLASELASYITGAILPVDGGYALTRAPGKTLLRP